MVFMVKRPGSAKSERLVTLGARISVVDQGIISLVAERERLVSEVARYKMKNNLPLLRKKIERKRRAQWVQWAREYGMSDPEDARTLFNVILAIMCRREIEEKDREAK